jgi:hypothetical protein
MGGRDTLGTGIDMGNTGPCPPLGGEGAMETSTCTTAAGSAATGESERGGGGGSGGGLGSGGGPERRSAGGSAWVSGARGAPRGGWIEGLARASRISAARSTRAFDRASRRVNRNVSPESCPSAAVRKPTTRPSPRRRGSPRDSVTSNLRTTPCGRDWAPGNVTVVRVNRSSSRCRNSSSDENGREIRIATGTRASSGTSAG